MVFNEKTFVAVTYAPYSNQLRDINPTSWFTRYVATYVREVDYVKTKIVSFVKNSRSKPPVADVSLDKKACNLFL